MAQYIAVWRALWKPYICLMIILMLIAAMGAKQAWGQFDFASRAEFVMLMDYESGTVLFQKNADSPMPPASMAKLMTIAVVFDQLQSDRLQLDDEFLITENAWRKGGSVSGGSTMFAEPNSKIKVEDLVKSVIVQSGNDASIALAEGIAGSEKAFARLMNRKAQQIGLKDSNFTNATGLPDPDLVVTSRDLVILARHLIRDHAQYYKYFALPEFRWNDITQRNRNPLLRDNLGADGLKTGRTEQAGFGIVASTLDQDGKRLIMVLNGLESATARLEEAQKLLRWGNRNFESMTSFTAEETVGYARVYGGSPGSVALVTQTDLSLTLPKGERHCLRARIDYRGPLMPPVQLGDKVASLNVLCHDKLIQSTPLYAARAVKKGGLVAHAIAAARELMFYQLLFDL